MGGVKKVLQPVTRGPQRYFYFTTSFLLHPLLIYTHSHRLEQEIQLQREEMGSHPHCADYPCCQGRNCSWRAHDTEVAGWSMGAGTGTGKSEAGARVSPPVMGEGQVCLGLKPHWTHRYH